MKRKVGRPKGSVNKNKVATAAPAKGSSDCVRIALNQVEHATAIKNLEIVVNVLTNQVQDLSRRITKLELPAESLITSANGTVDSTDATVEL